MQLALLGAVVWSLFSFATGLAWALWFLVVARSGSSIGKAVVDPTHNSLIADYYAPEHRPKAYSFHRAANAVGAFLGPLLAGVIAFNTSWRVPFFVFAVPTIIIVVLGLRVKEPVRGAHERRAMGASEEAIMTEEAPPSFGEAMRLCDRIESLRRIWWALPFFAAALIGFASLASLFYEEVYNARRARPRVRGGRRRAGAAHRPDRRGADRHQAGRRATPASSCASSACSRSSRPGSSPASR